MMNTRRLAVLAAMLLAAAPAQAALTINTGTYYVLPGTYTIPLSVTGLETDLIAGLNFAVQLGDGGVDNGGSNTTPTITAVDLAPLFVPGSTEEQLGSELGKQIWIGDILVKPGVDPVRANGTFAQITFNVGSSVTDVTKFDLKLKDVWQSVWGNDQYTDFATASGLAVTPATTNGAIVVLPNGHSMTWQSGATGTWAVTANWTDSIATYPAGVTRPPFPDFTADVIIPGGTVTVAAAEPSREARSVTVNGSGTLAIETGKTLTVTNQLRLETGGTLSLVTGAGVAASGVQLAGGTIAGAGAINAPIELTGGNIVSTDTLELNGAITGTGLLTASGSGVLQLGAGNSYSGGTIVSAGTLRLNAAGALPAAGNCSIATGAILDLGNFDAATGGLSGNGVVDKLSNTTPLSTLAVASGTFNGVLQNTQGALALNKVGTGTLVLVNDHTYTGGTTVSGGTLQIGNGNSTGSVLGNVVMANNSVLDIRRSGSFTFNAAVSGDGSLSVRQSGEGGAIVLGNTNSYTGGTSIVTGTLRLGAAGALPADGNVSVPWSTVLDLNDFDAAIGDLNGGGTVDKTSSATPSNTLSVASGHFWNVIKNTQGTLALNKVGSGLLILDGDNTYTGGTTISGGTLQIGWGSDLGSILGNVVNNGTLAIDRWNSFTFEGAISGTGNVTVAHTGSGAIVLAAANSYTGGTMVSSGTLRLGANGALPNGNLVVNAAATLDVSSYGATATGLSGTGIIDKQASGASTLTVASGAFGGIIRNSSGSLALVKTGPETLVLSGANTYGGGTTISEGMLQLGDGGAAGSINGNVVNNAILAFNRADNYAFNGAISGTGSLLQAGTGTTTLGSAGNNYSGGTTIAAGTLRLGVNGALPAGPVAVAGTLDLNNYNATINTLSGTGVIDKQSSATAQNTVTVGSGTFGGVLRNSQGLLALAKTGSGTLALSGANTYGGGTTVNDGILQIDSAAALPAGGALTIGSGGTVVLSSGLSGNAVAGLSSQTSSGNAQAVPEPGTLTLLAACLLALWPAKRLRRAFARQPA